MVDFFISASGKGIAGRSRFQVARGRETSTRRRKRNEELVSGKWQVASGKWQVARNISKKAQLII